MRIFSFLLLFFTLVCDGQELPEVRFHGIKIFVNDLGEAELFYTQITGFEVKSRTMNVLEMATGIWPVYLVQSKGKAPEGYPNLARTGFTLQTYKLLPMIDQLRENGIVIYDSLLSKNGVGVSIPFQDPSGNVLSLMEVQIREVSRFEGLRIYNTGVTISNMERAFDFYGHILGFEEWSRDYLPDALPLKHHDGSFAFMLHQKSASTKTTIDHGRHPHISLIFETANPAQVKSLLTQRKVPFTIRGRRIIVKDPEGNSVEIQETGK